MKIHWKNVAENLMLTLLAVIVGVAIGYKVSITTAMAMLEEQKTLIEIAIRKETTAITNTVTNEFKKIKSRKSGPINIVIDPQTNTKISQKKQEIKDSAVAIKKQKQKGFFSRLFSKKRKNNK